MLVGCQLSFGACVCVHGRGLCIFDFEHVRVFVLTSGAEAWGGRVYIVAKSFLMFGGIKALLAVLRCGWWICGQVTHLVSAELDASL